MSIHRLPVEIFFKIADALESPSDIKNFACSCRFFYSVASSNYLQMCFIRAPLNSSVWEQLTRKCYLARNIRTLTVQYQDGHNGLAQIVPHVLGNSYSPNPCSLLCAEHLLVLAVQKMIGLTSFHWVNRSHEICDTLWKTLVDYCPNLQQVCAIDRGPVWGSDVNSNILTRNPSLFTLRNLTTFKFDFSRCNLNGSSDVIDGFAEMLVLNNKHLQVLHLDAPYNVTTWTFSSDATWILEHASWNSLRELRLVHFTAPSQKWLVFLDRHPSIQHLTLWNDDKSVYGILPKTRSPSTSKPILPSLKYLDAAADDVVTLIKPYPPQHQLDCIRSLDLGHKFLQQIERHGTWTRLERLDGMKLMGPMTINKIARVLPRLVWLSFSWKEVIPELCLKTSWIDALAKLTCLTNLEGVSFVFPETPPVKKSIIIRRLVQRCPGLRRLSCNIVIRNVIHAGVIIIEHNGKKVDWFMARLGETEEENLGVNWRGTFDI